MNRRRLKSGKGKGPAGQANSDISLPEESASKPWGAKLIWSAAAIVVLFLVLNVTGINWGRTGYVPWQPDSIEGVTAAREMEKFDDVWVNKYPRGYFLINAIFYKPLMSHWDKHPVIVESANGQSVKNSITQERLDLLAKITRWISLLMAMVTIPLVMLVSKEFFDDDLSAILSGLALALTHIFAFYSTSACVDVPVLFFFTLSMYYALKAVNTDKWRYYLLMGFSIAYTIGVKEGVSGFVLGLGLAIWALMIQRDLGRGRSLMQAIRSVFCLRIFAAIAMFAVTFMLLNGFLNGPGEFAARVGRWKEVTEGFTENYQSQGAILARTLRTFRWGLGWPFVGMLMVSIVYFAKRHRYILFFAVGPLVAFYLSTTVNIYLAVPRVFFLAYSGTALLIGVTSARWLTNNKFPIALRIAVVSVVFGCSFVYCLGNSLELHDDTRIRTEKWVRENISPEVYLATNMRASYAPRLKYQGYKTIYEWRSDGIKTRDGKRVFWPEYLIMSRAYGSTKNENGDFIKALYKEDAGYEIVATFKTKYLSRKTIFGIFGYPAPKHYRVSPGITIFKKSSSSK